MNENKTPFKHLIDCLAWKPAGAAEGLQTLHSVQVQHSLAFQLEMNERHLKTCTKQGELQNSKM